MIELKKSTDFAGPEGSVVLVIMDGIGIGKNPESDYVKQARTPNLNWLKENALYTELRAHGVAVGLPDDGDMAIRRWAIMPLAAVAFLNRAQLWLERRLLRGQCMPPVRFGMTSFPMCMTDRQHCTLSDCFRMGMCIPT